MSSGGRLSDTKLGRKQLIALIAFAAVCAALAIALPTKNAIWEGWLIDRLFQFRSSISQTQNTGAAPVAVVGLDQTSLDSDRLAPLPRVLMTPVFADAGQALLDAGALALGYDFVFAYSADSFVDPNTDEKRLQGYDQPFQKFVFRNRDRVFISHTEVGVPHRKFSAAAGAGGVRSVTVFTDSDGVVRQHQPILPLEDSPHLVDALLGVAGSTVAERYTSIPTSRLASSVPYLSLVDILVMQESAAGREALKTFAAGRIVLFGSLLPYEDEHLYSDRFLPNLPAAKTETGESGRPGVQPQTAGVLILADLIGSVLSDRIAISPAPWVMLGIAVLFALGGALAGLFVPLAGLPVVAAGGVAAGLGLSLAGLEYGFLLPPGIAPVAYVSAMVIAGLGKVGILRRRQRSLVRLFGHYLAPDVINQMAHSEQLPELGGDTRHVVIAFIDIVGFTKMSEHLADRDVVRVVNACFGAVGKVITAHQGYIDKYIGDAVMAVWNAPNTVENPEKAAVDAAREITGLLSDLRKITGQRSLDLRVALHAGPVLVGDIGGEHRRSFTVMGTTVNTASRIETVAKTKNVRLAISGTVTENLPRSYPVSEIWKGQLRGLSADVSVFTLDLPEMRMDDDVSSNRDGLAPNQGNLINFPR